MELIKKELDCALLESAIIPDKRGIFMIPFSVMELHEHNLPWENTYQLNHSITTYKGIVRGPNYQEKPYEQAKVVRCVKGTLYSVGVCMIPGKNYGKHAGFVLSEENKRLMYLPRGYAHGFVTLEDNTELEYLTDNQYNFNAAKSIKWNELGIDWTVGGKVQIKEELLSEKNFNAPKLGVSDFMSCHKCDFASCH